MSVDIINDLAKTGTRLSRIAQTLFELPELPGVAFGPRDLDAQMDGLLRNLIAEIQALEAAPPSETPALDGRTAPGAAVLQPPAPTRQSIRRTPQPATPS